MKKKILFLMALLTVSLLALAEMTVYVYKKDGTTVQYLASTIDSIGFVDVFNNGHEYVDLGLPSGTLWATMNVGADSPEDYGDYFAWGEITPKSSFSSSNYTYSKNSIVLSLSDDAANANWGGAWRMPTKAEIDELCNTSYTTWTITYLNGVEGRKITSKLNGNSIFLPAADEKRSNGLFLEGSGSYWSNTAYSISSRCSYSMDFNRNGATGYVSYLGTDSATSGRTVRPVLKK